MTGISASMNTFGALVIVGKQEYIPGVGFAFFAALKRQSRGFLSNAIFRKNGTLTGVFGNGDAMLTMVVTLNMKKNDGRLKVAMQLFDPDNRRAFEYPWTGF